MHADVLRSQRALHLGGGVEHQLGQVLALQRAGAEGGHHGLLVGLPAQLALGPLALTRVAAGEHELTQLGVEANHGLRVDPASIAVTQTKLHRLHGDAVGCGCCAESVRLAV